MSSDYCKPTPFVIFLQGRTGSTFLVECLDSHPRIQCDTERLVGFRKHGADKQLQWSSQYLDRSGKCDLGAVGFKTKLEDVLDPKRFTLLLQQLDARILVTQRRNIVKLIVSWFNSERIYDATGDWNVYDNVLPHEPMLVDPQEFDSRLKSVVDGKERLDNFVQGLGLQSLSVDYENLLVN